MQSDCPLSTWRVDNHFLHALVRGGMTRLESGVRVATLFCRRWDI
jgi:hypothetical protein